MSTPRGFTVNDVHNGMSFNNLDDMQPSTRRFSPIKLRPENQLYQPHEIRNDDKYSNPEPKGSKFCSKQCLIGLCIGLAIGIALVIAIAVPIGVTKTCGSSAAIATTSCTTTTSSTSAPSCIGIISSTPNWTGTFLMDNGCLIGSSCCCLFNQIALNRTTSNQILITGSVVGKCASVGSTVSLIVPMSTTFQTGFFWGLEAIRLQLGQDNSYVSFVNTANPYCSATALRTS